MPGLETQLYRFLARLAAKQFSRFDPVLSVYARRSVACGEVVFGNSDIDLHLVLKPGASLDHEAQCLRNLANHYAKLKRLIPCIGDCNVSTTVELATWYRVRPYTWYRDREWLKLSGKDWTRPWVALKDSAARDSLLWWFFWAWERMPGFYRAGNVRTCCNLFLDMVNVYGLYLGAFEGPQRRAAVLAYWRTLCPPSRELTALTRGFVAGFRGRYRYLLQWLYGESLKLSEALATHVTHTLEGEGCGPEVYGQVPFSFAPRTYLLVDPFREDQVTQALATMRHKARIFVTTEKALKLYLYHRNPWEYYLLQAPSASFSLLPPPEEALHRSVRFALHKEVPRSAGFSIGKTIDRSATVGLQYAQCRLYGEQGKIATSAEDLRQQYRRSYGAWPYRGEASREVYFLHDYPVMCQMIEALSHYSAYAFPFENEALQT
jgi:hypothetical protein